MLPNRRASQARIAAASLYVHRLWSVHACTLPVFAFFGTAPKAAPDVLRTLPSSLICKDVLAAV